MFNEKFQHSKFIKFVHLIGHDCMKVNLIDDPFVAKRPVVTIGIFDGVHIGHQYILDRLKKEARGHRGESTVVTLWPHPRIVLNKDVWNFRLLHSREEKTRELERRGVDRLIIVPFNREVASLSACEFVVKYLVKKIGVEVLIMGYDNKFGHDRRGDAGQLEACAHTHGFRVVQLHELTGGRERVNSTTIRNAVLLGQLEQARKLLGYHYYLTGTIVGGDRIGRKFGFPTANVHPLDPYKLIPLGGVYAVRIELGGAMYGGMLNIGYRPTIDSASEVKTIETHIFDVSGDFYGEQVVIHFIQRIRDEMKFSGIDELKSQLDKDRIVADRLLRDFPA